MAPEDPLYFLIASFIGYIRAIWTDCHDYDYVQNADNDDCNYLYDTSALDIKYELGSFWTISKIST